MAATTVEKHFRVRSLALLFTIFACLALSGSADPQPKVATWSDKTYGPDGPWSAVTVGFGTNKSGQALNMIDLFPGAWIYNLVPARDFCDNMNPCPAKDAGLFAYLSSTTADLNVTTAPGTVFAMGNEVARKTEGKATILTDTIRMDTSPDAISVKNAAIDAIHEETITLPDGSTYSPQIGSLAIGSIDPVRAYPYKNGEIIPNYLAREGIIPSASSSLHYGSANTGPNGSLVWGGYDQNRVIGPVGKFAFQRPDGFIQPNLVDIQIGVDSGESPFPEPSYTGLLQLNNSMGLFQTTTINPILPYLFFSAETCSSIAQHLPVTLEALKGLYTWNTNDPQYKRITTSPSYLALVFRSGGQDTDDLGPASNLTIKIPFALLDLTLDTPIVQTKQQYFPCYPLKTVDDVKGYFLGRAFLQAAWLGMNLNQSTFFLAQGPGPDAGKENIQPIGLNDTDIKSIDPSNFANSWQNHWTPLTASSASSLGASAKGGSGSGLSGGAIAGIVVGVVVFVAIAVGLMAFLLFRRRKQRQHQHQSRSAAELAAAKGHSASTSPAGSKTLEKEGDFPGAQNGAGAAGGGLHEAPAQERAQLGDERLELEEDKALVELPPEGTTHASR